MSEDGRTIWVYRDGVLIDKREAPPLHPQFGQSAFVISDCMDSLINHADGRRYDSKRAFEKAVRAAGCEIVGNETIKPASKPEMTDPVHDVKAALDQIESRSTISRKRKKRG